MSARRSGFAVGLTLAIVVVFAACDSLPGKPKPGTHDLLHTEVVAFDALYARRCAGCHGIDGRLGPARPLNDPVYLALVSRDRLTQVIASGVPGTSQPAFAQSAGGDLTDRQVEVLVDGLISAWGHAGAARDASHPPYAATASGDQERGRNVFAMACASCHGPEGRGGPKGGSIVDPSYLALVSDQGLRTTVMAGRPDLGMPDWRGYVTGQPLSPQQISDVTAWLVAQRRPVPGRRVSETDSRRSVR